MRRLRRHVRRSLVLALSAAVVLSLPNLERNERASAVSSASDAAASIAAAPEAPRALSLSRSLRTVVSAEPPKVVAHVAQEGETLESLAARFHVRAETIAFNNAIGRIDGLQGGMQLRIPTVDAAIHDVAEGETVESLAAKYGVDAKAIVDANRLLFEPENFAPGRGVLVPIGEGNYPGFAPADGEAPRAAAAPTSAARPAPAIVAAPRDGRLSWPAPGSISQYFAPWHTGVDIAAPYGTAVGASDAGVVSAVGWVAVGGLRVCVRHPWGVETCYYHLGATYVAVGQLLARGQVVGAVGMTGVTTGPHVHWEANLNGALVNPLGY